MDWREFAANVLGTFLSWPVLIFVLVLTFHRPLRDLVGRLRHAEIGDQTLDFSERLERAQELGAEAAEDAQKSAGAKQGAGDSSDASGLIIHAWDQVRQALVNFHDQADLHGSGTKSVLRLAEDLRDSGRVNDTFVSAVGELTKLRNLVAHGLHRPTAEESERYVNTAQEVVRAADLFAMRPSRPSS
jgi:hypothetical protein